MSLCLFVCLSIRHTFSHRFIDIFAPTSWSEMSKLFKCSESLRRSNGKNLSQIWKLLLIKGVKLPHRKKLFCFVANFALPAEFFWYRCYYLHWFRNLCLPYAGFSPNRPTGSIWSSSCNVHVIVCVFVPFPYRL